MDFRDRTTRVPADNDSSTVRATIPALTILCHPDLERVGDRVLLRDLCKGRRVPLSRNTPDLLPPGKLLGTPLEDLYLSRRPLMLHPGDDGGVVIVRGDCSMRVMIGEEQLDRRCTLPAATVQEGLTFELAERVVLLLHLVADEAEHDLSPYGLVGESDAIVAARRAIARVADLEVPVLLRGESGTGKELVARAIHYSGPRRDRPFVGVNLSAVTPSLAAAELFGAARGAYTGLVGTRSGYFLTADGGTLFLDEVGECPAEVQTMLLRAIETSEIRAVGSDDPKQVDVRLVAATDSNLEAKATSGVFKEPLLHRLSAYEIWLAPLRQRRDDIGRLLVHFAAEACSSIGEELPRHREDGPPWIPSDLAVRLSRYHWPGNVRQLRNLVWQLVIDSRGKPQLESSPRLERLLTEAEHGKNPEATTETPTRNRRPADISEEEIVAAMREACWDIAAAARKLDISRPSLYDRIRRSNQLRTAEDLEQEEIDGALAQHDGDLDAAASQLQVSARGLRRRVKRLEPE